MRDFSTRTTSAIRGEMARRCLTMSELALALDTPRSTVQGYFFHDRWHLATLAAIAAALDMPLSELLEKAENLAAETPAA